MCHLVTKLPLRETRADTAGNQVGGAPGPAGVSPVQCGAVAAGTGDLRRAGQVRRGIQGLGDPPLQVGQHRQAQGCEGGRSVAETAAQR